MLLISQSKLKETKKVTEDLGILNWFGLGHFTECSTQSQQSTHSSQGDGPLSDRAQMQDNEIQAIEMCFITKNFKLETNYSKKM